MVDGFSSLVAFTRVADRRSFTEAARDLGLSASALGKSVARLEERVGARLFHRSTRSVALTAEGSRFLTRCRRILEEYDAARGELSAAVAAPRGRLRVSLPLVSVVDARLLADFIAAFPLIDLDLDYTDRLVDVIDEGFDVVIRTGEAKDTRLVARRLTRFQNRVVASPFYVSLHGAPATPADLERHARLLYRFPATGLIEPWPLQGADRLARLPATAAANAVDSLVEMSCAGLGLACLPDFAVRAPLADGRLVAMLDDFLGPPRNVALLWPSGRPTTPKVRVFVDFLLARMTRRALTPSARE